MDRRIRPLAPLWAAVASILVLACGGDNLVLPSEGTAASIAVTRGNNQTGTVGAALADSLQVRVLDKEGRAVPNQPVTWSVTAGNGSVAPASNTTDANGYAGARWTLGTSAGAQQVVAKPTGNSAPDNLQALFAAIASASAASKFSKVSGDNQTAVAGSVLADSLVVRVSDADNNPVPGVQVSWAVTGNGAVSSPTTTSGADGRTGVKWTLGATAGAQGVTATAAPLPSAPVSFSATATVGSAGRLAIIRQPSSTAASGARFAQQPQVQIEDAGGNPVSMPGIAVQAGIASHPGSGTLVGNATAITVGNGLATFTDLGIAGPPGDYTLNFSVPNRDDISGTPPSTVITVAAGAPSQLDYDVPPSSITAGGTITPAVTVRIEDAQGNLVTSATTSVSIALAANPGNSTLSGTTTVAATGGIATFADLSLNRPGTGYTLRASASGLSAVTSAGFNVTTGGATTIAANSSTSLTGTVGSAATPRPSVKVTDAQGNGVSGVTVTFAVTQGGGSVSGATPATDAQGVATVGNWTLGATAGSGNNKLTATVSGLSGSPVEFTASANPGSAGKLGFLMQPAPAGTSGQALSPQPILQLYDSDNNPVSQGGITVTATLSAGPGGTLTNATAVTTSNGRATFSGLRISGPAGTYNLAFSAPDVAGVTSNDIAISAGAATKLGMARQPTTSVQNGQVFPDQPIVQLQDADGNSVNQPGITVNASLQQGGATLGGDASVQTNASGQAVFTDLRITGATGTYSLLFAAAGKTTVSSTDIQLTAGPVSAANSDVSPASGSFTAGDAGGFSFTVSAKDQSQNPVPGASVTFSGAGSGTFEPASGTTDAAGNASIAFKSTAAGAHQITVTVGGVALADKPSVTVTPAAADAGNSSLLLSPTSITLGQQTTVTVTFEDQFGNPLADQNVVLSVSGGAGTFGNQSPTLNGSGQASTTFTPTSSGALAVSATLGALTEQADLTVNSAPASGTNSSLDVGSPATLMAGVTRQVTVTARNTLDQPMPGAQVSLQMSPTAGTTVSPSVPQVADGSGVATFTVSGTAAGNETISASVDGIAVQQAGVLTITPAAPSAAKSFITATPGTIDQENPVSVTATFHDQYDNAIANSDVMLSSDRAGSFANSSPTTDGSGTVTTTFTPGSGSGSPHTLTATMSGVQVTFQLTVTVSPPPPPTPDASQSTVAATSPVAADAPSTVIVTVIGTDGNPMSGVTVTLAEAGSGGNVVNPAQPTDSNGQTQGSFSASTPGNYTIQATAGGVIINQTASIVVQ
jgi:hypothetical protein